MSVPQYPAGPRRRWLENTSLRLKPFVVVNTNRTTSNQQFLVGYIKCAGNIPARIIVAGVLDDENSMTLRLQGLRQAKTILTTGQNRAIEIKSRQVLFTDEPLKNGRHRSRIAAIDRGSQLTDRG